MTASSAMTSSPRQAWASAHQLGAIDTDSAIEAYTEIDIPQSLRDNLALFLRLERRVLQEYDPAICELFDKLLNSVIHANEGNPGTDAADEPVDDEGVPTSDAPGAAAFRHAVELIDELPHDQAQVVIRAFTTFFHLSRRFSTSRTSPRRTTA